MGVTILKEGETVRAGQRRVILTAQERQRQFKKTGGTGEVTLLLSGKDICVFFHFVPTLT